MVEERGFTASFLVSEKAEQTSGETSGWMLQGNRLLQTSQTDAIFITISWQDNKNKSIQNRKLEEIPAIFIDFSFSNEANTYSTAKTKLWYIILTYLYLTEYTV